jgi:hypothetical protein
MKMLKFIKCRFGFSRAMGLKYGERNAVIFVFSSQFPSTPLARKPDNHYGAPTMVFNI